MYSVSSLYRASFRGVPYVSASALQASRGRGRGYSVGGGGLRLVPAGISKRQTVRGVPYVSASALQVSRVRDHVGGGGGLNACQCLPTD